MAMTRQELYKQKSDYNKEHYTAIHLRFSKTKDAEVLEFLESQEMSKNSFIKKLIINEMNAVKASSKTVATKKAKKAEKAKHNQR